MKSKELWFLKVSCFKEETETLFDVLVKLKKYSS